jgi:hypothetical protein
MKASTRNIVVFLLLAGLTEFVLVPYSYFVVFPLVQGADYLAGLLLLSLPRVIFVLLFVFLMKARGGISLWIAAAIYAVALVLKFSISEIYIQPDNPYAIGTAVLPYLIGFGILVASGFLLWRRKE